MNQKYKKVYIKQQKRKMIKIKNQIRYRTRLQGNKTLTKKQKIETID